MNQSAPLLTTRKIVHMSMLVFAFLLPFLTWVQAAGCAVLALLFNVLILPRLEVDLRKGTLPETSARKMDRLGTGSPSYGPSATLLPFESVWTGIVIYPISVLVLILLYRRSMQIVAAVWAIMALGDGWASVAGERLRGPALPHNPGKTWWGFAAFLVAGTAGAYALTRWVAPALPHGKIFVVCAATAVVGALVESVPIRLDDNLTVPLVSGAFMFSAYLVERSALDGNWPFLGRRAWLALAVSLFFAVAAWRLKLVKRSGAAAGFLLGAAVYFARGYRSFSILLAFFLLGSIATRVGYAPKAARGIAEGSGGARGWREALANGLAGAFFSILALTTRHEAAFLLALVAAFAEAAGDTVSSEIGQWASDRAFLITTLRPVPAGENGGITFSGTAAGLVASAIVAALGTGLGLCGKAAAAVALAAAFAGNVLDSVLGAALERRGLVTNGVVNFTATSFAGALALVWGLCAGL